MNRRRTGSFFYTPAKAQDSTPEPVRRSGFLGWIGRAIRRICLWIGGLFLFSFCMGMLVAFVFGGSRSLPEDMILVLNVTDPIGETEHARSLTDPLASAGITIGDLIETLDRARGDDRVKGLLVSLDHAGMELAHIQELRTAIKRFRTSGKFAYIYTASFSDLGSGIGAYYLASAFDKIWMQPVGMVSITGLSLEMPFAREALDKIGVNPQFLRREEYKSAMESYTNTHMSEPNRESLQSIVDDLSKTIFVDIAEDRKIPSVKLQALIDKGLLTGKDALKEGVIDHLDYADILVDKTREEITGNKDPSDEPPLVMLEDYWDATSPSKEHNPNANVALVQVAGEIVPGSEPEPGYATGDYIASAIMDAADDESIKAIVMRVDSPGGSPSASETIRRSLVYAKEKGKRIIVSMGPLAASGGYWITVDADHIFAMPSTLTGSIGVIMGKIEISKLWDKVGVNWDAISWGQNARMWSMNKPMSEAEKVSLNTAIDDTYASFMERVSHGRKMSLDKVHKLAKGRAWTGLQAKENGLVDDIGGLDAAMDYTAQQIGLKDRTQLAVRIIPEPLSPLEELMHMLGSQVAMGNLPLNSKILVDAAAPLLKKVETVNRLGPVQAYDINVPAIKP